MVKLGEKIVTARARVKRVEISKTIQARAKVKRIFTKTIQARANIVNTPSKTIQARARIRQTGIVKTAQARARVKQVGITKNIEAQARILKTFIKALTAKAKITYWFGEGLSYATADAYPRLGKSVPYPSARSASYQLAKSIY